MREIRANMRAVSRNTNLMLFCRVSWEAWMQLADKVAVITGGGRGIGRAIALKFANEGAAVRLGVSKEEQLKGFLNTILQGHGQTAEEIADAALFLCSEKASAITGQALNVDGGAAFC